MSLNNYEEDEVDFSESAEVGNTPRPRSSGVKKDRTGLIVVAILVVVAVVACALFVMIFKPIGTALLNANQAGMLGGEPQDQGTPTLIPTTTPLPTATPQPTQTATPVPTMEPTATSVPVEMLGTAPVYDMVSAAEMVSDGDGLFPLRHDPQVFTHETTNNMGVDGLLLLSFDPGSSMTVKDPAGKVVAELSSADGFTVTMPFKQNYSISAQTTWNQPNGSWNLWGMFYTQKEVPGYTFEDFKWTCISYWDGLQGKLHNYYLDGTTFVDLGPDPVRPQ